MKNVRKTVVSIAFLATAVLSAQAMGGFGGMPMMGGFGGAMPGQTSAEAAKPDKGSQIPAGYNADGPTYVKVNGFGRERLHSLQTLGCRQKSLERH